MSESSESPPSIKARAASFLGKLKTIGKSPAPPRTEEQQLRDQLATARLAQVDRQIAAGQGKRDEKQKRAIANAEEKFGAIDKQRDEDRQARLAEARRKLSELNQSENQTATPHPTTGKA